MTPGDADGGGEHESGEPAGDRPRRGVRGERHGAVDVALERCARSSRQPTIGWSDRSASAGWQRCSPARRSRRRVQAAGSLTAAAGSPAFKSIEPRLSPELQFPLGELRCEGVSVEEGVDLFATGGDGEVDGGEWFGVIGRGRLHAGVGDLPERRLRSKRLAVDCDLRRFETVRGVRRERWQAIAEEEDSRQEAGGDGRLPRRVGRGELMLRDAVDRDVLKFGAGGEGDAAFIAAAGLDDQLRQRDGAAVGVDGDAGLGQAIGGAAHRIGEDALLGDESLALDAVGRRGLRQVERRASATTLAAAAIAARVASTRP